MNTKNNTAPNSLAAFLVLCLAIIFFQSGSAFAIKVFNETGAIGAAALRQGFSAVLLLVFARFWTIDYKNLNYSALIPYGLSLCFMNLAFYLSIERIPLGIAVAIEFSGPLLVSILSSRRPIDFLWILFAGAGIFILLPFHEFSQRLDPIGLFWAAIAAAAWAGYIYFGHKIGKSMKELQSVALGLLICAIISIPLVIIGGMKTEISFEKLVYYGLVLTLLSGAVPYAMEMYAMRRMQRGNISLLMSLDPAFAVLSGLVFLQQTLNFAQIIAVSLIIIASIGATLQKPQNPPIDEAII